MIFSLCNKSLLNFAKASPISYQLQDVLKGRVFQDFKSLSLRSFSGPPLNEPPKYPRNPYMIFSNDKLPELRKSHPDVKIVDLSKMIGQLWRKLSEKDKDGFKERYKEERQEYEVKVSGMSEEQKQELKQLQKDKRLKKKNRKLKLLMKELGRPVARGLNPYLLFAKSKMIERGDASLKMYVLGVSDLWKKMPEDDKKEFVDQARKNSVVYKRDLLRWETKMIQMGNEKLLSTHKLRLHKVGLPVKKASAKKVKTVKELKGDEKKKK